MKAPFVPLHEADRLADLKRLKVLDTEEEAIFDEITTLAATICDSKMALISLVDQDRQWFKSRFGLKVTSTPRNISFCGHTILETKLMEVCNATQDPRFSDNPLVLEDPSIRFYAGSPLITENGFCIGTLCVIDSQEKKLNLTQKRTLELLSKQIMNILELRASQVEADLMKDQLEGAQSLSKIGSWQWNFLSKEHSWSQEHYRLFEIDSQTTGPELSKKYKECIPLEDWELLEAKIQQACQHYQTEHFTFQHRIEFPQEKRIKHIRGIAKITRDPHGIPFLIHGTRQDVTQEFEREVKFQNILNTLNEGLVIQNETGKIIQFNPAALSILGLTEDEILGRSSSDPRWRSIREDGSSFPGHEHPSMVSLKTGKPMIGVLMGLQNHQGYTRWIRINSLPQDTSEGKRVLTTFSDITKEVEAAKEIENFFQLSIDCLCIASFDGYFKRVNPIFSTTLGYPEAVLLKNPLLSFIHPEDQENTLQQILKLQEGEKIIDFENRFLCRDGSSRDLRWSATPDHKTKLIYAIGVNITQERHQKKELLKAYQKAEEATRAKSNFLSTMSHEIRTPLNGIIGMTDILADTPLNSDQKNIVQTLTQASQTLLTLINDILDFSKIEAGHMQIEWMECDVITFLNDFIRTFQLSAQTKGLSLLTHFQTFDHFLILDPGRLGQIVSNLLSNALKFTKEGTITIEADFEKINPHKTKLTLTVTDTGIGMSEEAQKKLFQPFSQAEMSTTREYGGTGLGLSIIKKLIEMMHGHIHCESRVQQGTRFTIELICSTGKNMSNNSSRTQKQVLTDQTTPFKSVRILVAEDNQINQIVIGRMLQKLGIKYHLVSHGKEVLNSLQSTHYDLILMDCQMPEMNGYETTSKIRNTPSATQHIPIVALTANATKEDEARCLQVGMNGYLSKPINLSHLTEVLASFLKKSAA